jgi:hypothetical protein
MKKMIVEGSLWPFAGLVETARDDGVKRIIYPVQYRVEVAKEGDWMRAEMDLGQNLVWAADGSAYFDWTDTGGGQRDLAFRAALFSVALPRTAVITDAKDGVEYLLTREGEVVLAGSEEGNDKKVELTSSRWDDVGEEIEAAMRR